MLLYGRSGSGKSTLAECALALASTTDAILILDDIDLDCNVRQLRRDLDHGLWIIATAADIPESLTQNKTQKKRVILAPSHDSLGWLRITQGQTWLGPKPPANSIAAMACVMQVIRQLTSGFC